MIKAICLARSVHFSLFLFDFRLPGVQLAPYCFFTSIVPVVAICTFANLVRSDVLSSRCSFSVMILTFSQSIPTCLDLVTRS